MRQEKYNVIQMTRLFMSATCAVTNLRAAVEKTDWNRINLNIQGIISLRSSVWCSTTEGENVAVVCKGKPDTVTNRTQSAPMDSEEGNESFEPAHLNNDRHGR